MFEHSKYKVIIKKWEQKSPIESKNSSYKNERDRIKAKTIIPKNKPQTTKP